MQTKQQRTRARATRYFCAQWLAALGLCMVIPASLAQSSMQLTIGGDVGVGTCNLDAGDANRLIPLPTISASTLNSGYTASYEPFKLRAINCAGVGQALFHISGMPDNQDPSLFLNTGTAQNVGLELTDGVGNRLCDENQACTGGSTVTSTVTGGSATASFQATYVRTGVQAVAPGTFTSQVAVTMEYR